MIQSNLKKKNTLEISLIAFPSDSTFCNKTAYSLYTVLKQPIKTVLQTCNLHNDATFQPIPHDRKLSNVGNAKSLLTGHFYIRNMSQISFPSRPCSAEHLKYFTCCLERKAQGKWFSTVFLYHACLEKQTVKMQTKLHTKTYLSWILCNVSCIIYLLQTYLYYTCLTWIGIISCKTKREAWSMVSISNT